MRNFVQFETFAVSNIKKRNCSYTFLTDEIPSMKLKEIFFFRISQDGNSLYNACSRAFVGDESMSICLRCLSIIELYLNADYYASHTFFENVGAKSGHQNVLKYGLPVQALESYISDNPIAAIRAEALCNAENYKHGSFVCMMALSSVLRQPIESYFPIADA